MVSGESDCLDLLPQTSGLAVADRARDEKLCIPQVLDVQGCRDFVGQ